MNKMNIFELPVVTFKHSRKKHHKKNRRCQTKTWLEQLSIMFQNL